MRTALLLIVAACGSRDREPATSAPAGSNVVASVAVDAAPATGSAGSATPPSTVAPVARRVVQLTLVELYDSREVCALLDDGKLRCWGSDAATPVEITTPARLVTILDQHAIDDTGVLWERYGMAAEGTIRWERDKASATGKVRGYVKHYRGFFGSVQAAIVDGRVVVRGNEKAQLPAPASADDDPREREHPVAGITNATVVALNAEQNYHGCAVDNAQVKCWRHPELVAVDITPGTALVSVGKRHMCTLDDGKVKCWNNTYSKSRVEIMPGLDGATSLASGSIDGGRKQICGIAPDGAVRCTILTEFWIGSEKPPTATPLLDGLPPATGLVMDSTSCASLRDGGVTCWGSNFRGELGDGTLVDRATPAPVKHILDDKPPHPPATGFGTEPQATTEMDWTGLPAKCSKPERIADVAIVSAYVKGKEIRLASYRVDAALLDVRPRGAQRAIDIEIERRTYEGKSLPLAPGKYPFSKGALQAAETFLMGPNMRRPLIQHGDSIELTFVDNTWVCGVIKTEKQRDVFAARRLDPPAGTK